MRRKRKPSVVKSPSLLPALKAESKALAHEIASLMERKQKTDALIASYEGKAPSAHAVRVTKRHHPLPTNSPFYGLTLPEIVAKVLGTQTEPRVPREIWALIDGKFPTTSRDPIHGVQWALQRRSKSHGDVMLIGEGKWGMSDWYTEEERKKITASLGPMSGRDRANHIAKTTNAAMVMKARGVRMGAPKKMTPEIISKLRQLIENGLSVAEASKEVGIKASTFYAHSSKGAFPGLKVKKPRKSGSDEPDLLSRNPLTGAVN